MMKNSKEITEIKSIQSQGKNVSEAKKGEQVALELIAHAKYLGMIKEKAGPVDGYEFAKVLFISLKREKSTMEGARMLEALLGGMDSLISIDRGLSYGDV